jgi:hypothetical protein
VFSNSLAFSKSFFLFFAKKTRAGRQIERLIENASDKGRSDTLDRSGA